MSRPGQVRYESFILRLCFLFAGQFSLYEGFQDWNRGRADLHPEVAVLTLLIYGASLFVIALALMPNSTVFKFRNFPLVPLVLATLVSVYVVAEIAYRGSYRTDVLAFSQYAAVLVTRGLNPYTQDLTVALSMFGVQPSDLTPLTSGSFLATFQYPSLHFLIFVPFVLAGLRDMRWVLVAFELGVIFLLLFKCPRNLRPMLILPLFAGSDLMINFTASSVSDMLWVLPLLLVAFNLDERPGLSGVFYGIACAVKQPPWLLAPFLVIYLLRNRRFRTNHEKLRRVGIFLAPALAVFTLVNLPFAIGDAAGWFRNIMTPISSDLIILSQGPAVLSQVGLVQVGRVFYSVLAVSVLIVLVANYYVYFEKLKYVVWILPGVILWFSYRALTSYVIYWMPLMLASLILWYTAESQRPGRSR
ncbi:MAG TPA: glycosyltransferase 87 family protein [Candidatus Bathyarchaeia archaeon]|nr:glycosyltransferase 87 family protein [Candidatus Bathyarchaeia archaeon]